MTPEELEHRLTLIEADLVSLKEVSKDVHELVLKFNKYESRWGLLVMMGTAIGSVIVFFKDYILHALGFSKV